MGDADTDGEDCTREKVAGDVDGMLPAIVRLISDLTILSIELPGVPDVVG